MVKRSIFLVVMLAFVWIILVERFTWFNIIIGIAVGTFILFFMRKMLPSTSKYLEAIERIRFQKLLTYPFWLIIQVYKSGFFLVKLMFTGSKYGIVTEKIELENEVLRAALMDSVTLTPGSICLGARDDEITLLCMDEAKIPDFSNAVRGLHGIEERLMKAESKDKSD